ncbi:MAG: sulfide:quinone oxidoreductase [Nitriliruptoraceae bacterium]|jgi:sulfide:quinone oxidoreductase
MNRDDRADETMSYTSPCRQVGGQTGPVGPVILTGTAPRPDETPRRAGGLRGAGSIFDFYSFDDAASLAEKLMRFEGGTVLVRITPIPIKCPLAPLEIEASPAWSARSWPRRRGSRPRRRRHPP